MNRSNSTVPGASKIDWREDLACDDQICQRIGNGDKGLLHDVRALTRRSEPPNDGAARSSNEILDCAKLVRTAADAKESGDARAYESAVQKLLDFFLADGVRDPAAVRHAFRLGAPSKADLDNEARVRQQLPFMDRSAVNKILCEEIDVDALDALREAECARALALKSSAD